MFIYFEQKSKHARWCRQWIELNGDQVNSCAERWYVPASLLLRTTRSALRTFLHSVKTSFPRRARALFIASWQKESKHMNNVGVSPKERRWKNNGKKKGILSAARWVLSWLCLMEWNVQKERKHSYTGAQWALTGIARLAAAKWCEKSWATH